jgi:hypothetical protein
MRKLTAWEEILDCFVATLLAMTMGRVKACCKDITTNVIGLGILAETGRKI